MTIKALLASASIGFAALAGSAQASANLIVDGGFESSGLIGIAGFADSGSQPVYVATSTGGYLPEEGGHFLALGGSPTLNLLSQTFSDVAGQTLQISYYLASDGKGPNEFQTIFDGAILADIVDVPSTQGSYQQDIFTVTATGDDTLAFGSEDSPNYLALDNVSVTPVGVPGAPEPSTWLLLLAGVGLIGATLRRRGAVGRPASA